MEVWRFCLDDVRAQSAPHGKSPYCHLAQLACMQTLVSRDSSSGTHANLWRTASGVLEGTNLPVQHEHPCHGNSHEGHGWTGCSCQPSATGNPPNQDYQRVKAKTPKRWVLEALDLQGLKEWPGSEQKQARELLLKWEHLFVCGDVDLGKTALIKHKIEVMDRKPFKEHYQCIPPHMYNDMRAHIQEMLDIGAIHKLHSPWASAVVLVQKKDGGLMFCVNLRKLNKWTVKDAYSLPHIDETLDSLQGSEWFSPLKLKLGYWQVKMDEKSKSLTAFTMGPLGFYECERMPFGLTNAHVMFLCLMETCLGDLNLHVVYHLPR